MQVAYIQKLLSKNKKDIAFVIGNGINRYYNANHLSWNDLLLTLWKKFSNKKQLLIPEGISMTEFYDALDINNVHQKKFSIHLQMEVQHYIKNLRPSHRQNILLEKIRTLNAPVITTNFDDLMAQTMQLKCFKSQTVGFTDYYPWSCYYASHKIEHPLKGFGIWHPHGMVHYYRSIKLGLSQYMGNVSRARKIIQSKHLSTNASSINVWEGDQTWLSIFFHKSLFIFGFGLDENEVFFRWLLIERAKYYKRYPLFKQKGWYVMIKDADENINKGKLFFLESVGIEVITLNTYQELYEKIWE